MAKTYPSIYFSYYNAIVKKNMDVNLNVDAKLEKPLLRLIEISANAIGTVYQDTFGVKAEVRRRQLLAEVDNAIKLSNKETENELLLCSQHRILLQEAKRQLNIENVVRGAVEHLPEHVGDRKPTEDWASTFFNIAQDIYEDEMQVIWSKILAGEVAKPGTYSKRTLESLKNLSQQEAQTFVRLMSFTFGHYVIFKLGNDTSTLNRFNFTFADWKTVHEAGLVSISEDVRMTISTPTKNFICGNKSIMFHSEKNEEIVLQIKQLTGVGTELSYLVEMKPNTQYLEALGQHYGMNGIKFIISDF